MSGPPISESANRAYIGVERRSWIVNSLHCGSRTVQSTLLRAFWKPWFWVRETGIEQMPLLTRTVSLARTASCCSRTLWTRPRNDPPSGPDLWTAGSHSGNAQFPGRERVSSRLHAHDVASEGLWSKGQRFAPEGILGLLW